MRVVYIGLRGDKLQGLQNGYHVFDKTYFITSGKFRRYHGQGVLQQLLDIKTLLLNSIDLFRVLAGTIKAWRLLGKVKPDVVFSKGGFVVVPVGFAAHFRGITIITHDSDTVPGLANRIVGRWAKLHATGMPPELYDYPKETISYTGIPLDERIAPVDTALQTKYKEELGLPKNSLVLLVGGAGLGAKTLNEKTVAITQSLLAAHPSLHIINITGSRNLDDTRRAYTHFVDQAMRDHVHILDFTPEFYKYTGAADIVVSRAGATTIAELAMQRKAAILIPAPFLTGGHQLKNAELVARAGAAEIIDNSASAEDLLKVVDNLLKNSSRRRELANKIGSLAHSDAADKLAELILDNAGSRG